VLHRNNAARRKARLTRQLVKLGGMPAKAPGKAAAKAAAAPAAKAPDKKTAAKKK
jgi:hypothetical protein